MAAAAEWAPGGSLFRRRSGLQSSTLDEQLLDTLNAPGKATQVDIAMLLRDTSPATMQRLQQLGFAGSPPAYTAVVLIGRIPLDKLPDLSN
jgi:hypothetical protein